MGVKQNQRTADMPAGIVAAPRPEVVEVAVGLPIFGTFCYAVPANLSDALRPGMRVLVPFGTRRTTGYVLGPGSAPPGQELRAIDDLLDERPLLPATLLPWLRWMAGYYFYPLGEAIRTALPGGLTDGDVNMVQLTPEGLAALPEGRLGATERGLLERCRNGPVRLRTLRRHFPGVALSALVGRLEQAGWLRRQRKLVHGTTRAKTERYVRLVRLPEAVSDRAAARRKLLALLADGEARAVSELKASIPTAGQLVRAMAAQGLVAIEERPVFRDPFGTAVRMDRPPTLTGAQQRAVAAITAALGNGFAPFLLAGVTGSGKTEVYLNATAAALARGSNVIVLAPEIALLAQIERRFRARFGEGIAVLHSGLSAGERYDQWQRIARAEVAIAIGARSAIFAPFAAIGLIIVDEEHDGAFKQETGLRYNSRDMALVRAQGDGAVVVLGSATPSMPALHAVRQGRYRRLALPERIEQRPLPAVEVVDLREQRDARGVRRFLTPRLIDAMASTLTRGEQVLLFVNRRGYAAYPVCVACGEVIRCRHCDISLTLHRAQNAYLCHYCGHRQAASKPCPHCGADKIRHLGLGTEKVEAAVHDLFPLARVARMDRDTVTRRGQLLQLLRQLHDRSVDVLVGTQMVAKGHDFPGITLVGVICADLTLNFPDFRSGERTFQLLAQVAGRAGRGDLPGRVLLQTFNPAHFSIQAACLQDPDLFYRHEIAQREALAYPPFTRLVMVRLAGRDAERTAAAARRIGALYRQGAADHGVEVLGPAPAPLARVAGRYRWQILLKAADAKRLRRMVARVQAEPDAGRLARDVQVAIDVDPQSML